MAGAIMAAAECREKLVLYGHTVMTLIIVLFAYILDRKTRSNLSLPAFCENFDNVLFGAPRSLRVRNYRRGVALVMALLVMNNLAVASTAAAATVNNTSIDNTASSAGGDVNVGDKLPPDCEYVVNCGDCLPCSQSGQYYLCCD